MEMTLKQGTLVKYTPAGWPERSGPRPGAAYCYWDLKWSLKKIESNLIGIVLETRGSKEVKVRWFGINETFMEHEEYLEIVK